jgi:hypothetical protein
MIANLGKRSGTVLVLVAVVAFQVVSFDRVLGLSETWTDAPVVSDDFAYHYANALTVRKFLRAGRWWGYDPTLYAGYPAGILSVDNRALELPTALLPLHPAVVQKLYLLAFWLSVPLMGWATARFAGFGRSVAGVTAVLAVLLAECSLMHFMFRWWGMIAFAWATSCSGGGA